MNPLLDFSGLPRFAEIRPEHVTPAIDELLADADAALERATSDAVPADYDALSAVLDVADRAAGARLGRGRPPARGGRHARAARRLHREPAAGHRVPHPARRRRAAVRQVQAVAAGAERGQPEPGAHARRWPTRCATSCCRRRAAKAPRRRASRSSRTAGRAARSSSPSTCSTRPTASRTSPARPSSPACPPTCVQATRAAAAGGRPRRLQAHAAPPELPAGDAVRDATARCASGSTRAYVTRASEFGPAELDNSAVDARAARAAPGGGDAARLRQLRRGVAGAEDGRFAAAGDRLPARPRAPRPPRRRCATSPSCATSPRSELGLAELQAWDIPFASERLKESRYAFSDQEVKQYFTEPKVLEGLFRIVETLFEVTIRPDQRAGLAPERALLPHRARSRQRCAPQLVGQFYLDPYARAGQAPRRLDGRRARPLAAPRGRAADAGRAPGLQLRRAARRPAGAADARRRHHAVPRVRPRPAPHADAGRRPRRLGHLRRRVGRGRAAEPVHGELLLGVGRASSG